MRLENIFILMNSIDWWMSAGGLHRINHSLLVDTFLTKINKDIEHSESEVIPAHIETFLMECINCSVVTIISKQINTVLTYCSIRVQLISYDSNIYLLCQADIVSEDSIVEFIVSVGDHVHQTMHNTPHEVSVLMKCSQLLHSITSLLITSSCLYSVFKNLDRNLRSRNC